MAVDGHVHEERAGMANEMSTSECSECSDNGPKGGVNEPVHHKEVGIVYVYLNLNLMCRGPKL